MGWRGAEFCLFARRFALVLSAKELCLFARRFALVLSAKGAT